MFIQLQGDFFYTGFRFYSFIQLKKNIGRANKKRFDSNEGNALKEKKPL